MNFFQKRNLGALIILCTLLMQIGCSTDDNCAGSQLIGTWRESASSTKGLSFGEDCSVSSNACEGDGKFTADTTAATGTTTLTIDSWNSSATGSGPLTCSLFKSTGAYTCNFTVTGSDASRQLSMSCAAQ